MKSGRRAATAWPKVHIIYFILAAFDLMAVAGGLYLSHRLSNIFEESVATNDQWNRRFTSVWSLGDLAAAVSAPSSNVFISKNAVTEREKVDRAFTALEGRIDSARAEIVANIPADLADRPLRSLINVDQALSTLVANSRRALADYDRGDMIHAAQSMALLEKSYAIVKSRINNTAMAVRDLQGEYGDGYLRQVKSLKRYEFFIGGGILFMVCCVVFYGHWVGSLMKRKYQELERANEGAETARAEAEDFATQLQGVNDDVVRLNRDLEDNLHKLRDAQDELVRRGRMAQLGQLTATVAHEIRNPLGAVRTSAYLLERKTKDKGLGIEPQLERIANGVMRCDNIITQLLDFARSSALTVKDIDFDEWLTKVLEDEVPKLPGVITVEFNPGAGGLSVCFDEARLQRAVINLLSNASEAMVGNGQDPSKFTCANPKITITTSASARGVEVAVRDNGPGISEANMKKIMEPLFTTKNFGTGLGLPAIEKIMDLHGGGLETHSTLGEGACFTLWLPIRQQVKQVA
ncbi:MAG TPA: ATP-binding protein [Aestuariivirga sp.]|nr:ATP-binding protein [Aestuariivirga sp.]